jgi:hypothetical protein
MADMLSMVKQRDQLAAVLSEAEVVLPVQFHSARVGAATLEPIRRLMVAVLVDAFRCFQTRSEACRPARREEYREVRSWLFSDADNRVFSFRAVCDALEIDPKTIRKVLAQWEEKRSSGQKRRAPIRRTATPRSKRISR